MPKVARIRDKSDKTKRTSTQRRSFVVKGDGATIQRGQEEKDPFVNYYTGKKLIPPPYAFINLYQIYEESDVLQICTHSMVQNIDGFGHSFQYLGFDKDESKDKEAKRQKTKLENFFKFVNEKESFRKIRRKMRADYEVLGNGAIECIRDGANKLWRMYYLPCRSMRMSDLLPEYPTMVYMPRDGKTELVEVPVKFRKYAQWLPNMVEPIWFKEFGDPRRMSYKTGKFEEEIGRSISDDELASEVLWFKQDFAGYPYGMPRWIGSVLNAKGRRSAQYINFDLFRSQGVPPFLVTVSNGVLTDDSVKDLERMLNSFRGTDNFNRGAILESTPESSGLEDKGLAKIEIKFLTDHRKEDLMFKGYLDDTDNAVRKSYRLPPIYTGSVVGYDRATALSSASVADQQVFIPEREDFDEVINTQILWSEFQCHLYNFRSNKPELVGADEIMRGVQIFAAVGALTMNYAIDCANKALGLQISRIENRWGDIPLNIVMSMLQHGIPLIGLAEVIEPDEKNRALFTPPSAGAGGGVSPAMGLAGMLGSLGPNAKETPLLEAGSTKYDLSDLSPEEQQFYGTMEKLEPFLLKALTGKEITIADCTL